MYCSSSLLVLAWHYFCIEDHEIFIFLGWGGEWKIVLKTTNWELVSLQLGFRITEQLSVLIADLTTQGDKEGYIVTHRSRLLHLFSTISLADLGRVAGWETKLASEDGAEAEAHPCAPATLVSGPHHLSKEREKSAWKQKADQACQEEAGGS